MGPSQDLYQDDRRIWNALFEIMTMDLAECERNGVDVGCPDEKFWPIVLANKGDWSYLVTWLRLYIEMLCRSFLFCMGLPKIVYTWSIIPGFCGYHGIIYVVHI